MKQALWILLIVALSACTGMSGTSSTDSGTASATGLTSASAASDVAPEAGDTDLNDASGVGTVVYLPSKPKELNTMRLLLGTVGVDASVIEDESEEEVEEDASEIAAEEEALAVSPTYSESCGRVDGLPRTQFCAATPEQYSFAVDGIYLVTCVDEAEAAVACTRAHHNVSVRQPLYEGETVSLTLTEEGISFPKELSEITTDMTVSGVQFLMSSFSQKLPSAGAKDAQMFASHLQGKSYQRCTTRQDDKSPEEMEVYCGMSDIEFGDILFDFDGDAYFGYIDTDQISPTEVFETAVRPESYETGGLGEFMQHLIGMKSFLMDGASLYNGFFAPIFAFQAPQAIVAGGVYDFSLTYDLNNTIGFIDGARAILAREEFVCVAGVAGSCVRDDDDSGSVGVYNPFYDAILMTKPPGVAISVEEKAIEVIEPIEPIE